MECFYLLTKESMCARITTNIYMYVYVNGTLSGAISELLRIPAILVRLERIRLNQSNLIKLLLICPSPRTSKILLFVKSQFKLIRLLP